MKWLYIFISFWVIVAIAGWLLLPRVPFVSEPNLGVSFTKSQAESLNLNWQEVYLAILDDLQVKNLRLQANWNEIEPQSGVYNFTDIDWQIAEADKRDVTVTLAIGKKLPRWPECHIPNWAASLPVWEIEDRVLDMLQATILNFKENSTIKRWQLENEPLFAFGDCTKLNLHFLQKELAMLKSLDSRPVLITDSGELSSWWETAGLADIQGVTLYQVTWNDGYGYWYYPIPRWIYRFKSALISPFVDYTIISELQMEPWGPVGLDKMSLEVAQQSFDLKRFRDNIEFFRGTGLREAYLWGVEWWYQAKVLGDDSLWNEAKLIFNQ
ncbi:MAG: hypothetical protein WC575_02420 [Patescibacteria group bacterium]